MVFFIFKLLAAFNI